VTVVTAADERYALGAGVAVMSAASHLQGRRAEIVILDCGIHGTTRAAIQRGAANWPNVAGMRFIPVPIAQLRGLPTPEHFTIATYARLLLPDLLPHADLILYLDADVLVRDDVGLLLRSVPDAAPAAAVIDFTHPTAAEGLLLPGGSDDPYFNAGVLAMRLGLWRRECLAAQALTWLTDNPEYIRYADQDAINALLATRVHRLGARWNVQTRPFHEMLRNPHDPRRTSSGVGSPRLLGRNPAIVHFVGDKPWTGTGLRPSRLALAAHAEWWQSLWSTNVLGRAEYVWTAGRAGRSFVPYAERTWGPRAQARRLRHTLQSVRPRPARSRARRATRRT
jgi:lipopolysaccharide biosynthesis glycosyltransferase